MDRYKIKENYITRNPDPNDWVNHPNGSILKIYSNLIKGNVLDFGCNHGACTFLLCDNKQVNKIIGIDLNKDSLDVALNTKKKYSNCNIDFICSNILDIELEEKFDTIVSFHTLEHIYPDDIDFVLTKLFNSLNINGFFIVSIPYEKAFDDGSQHVAFYNENTLSKLFEKNKFITIECLNDNRHSEGGILTGIFQKK